VHHGGIIPQHDAQGDLGLCGRYDRKIKNARGTPSQFAKVVWVIT